MASSWISEPQNVQCFNVTSSLRGPPDVAHIVSITPELEACLSRSVAGGLYNGSGRSINRRSVNVASGAGAEAEPAEVRWFGWRGRAGRRHREGREAQGRDGRDPGRDRLRPGGERRGVREVLRPEGRGMTDPPQGFPGPSYPLRANPSF